MSTFSASLFKAASGAQSQPVNTARSDAPFETPVFEEYQKKGDINGYMTALWKGVAARDAESLRVLLYLAIELDEVDNATDLMDMLLEADEEYVMTLWEYLHEDIEPLTSEQQNDSELLAPLFRKALLPADMAYAENHPGYQSLFTRFGETENTLKRAYLNNVGRQPLPEASEAVARGEFCDCAPQERKDEWRSLYRRSDCSSNQESIYHEAMGYAEQGDPFAMYVIGYLLSHGIETKYDHPHVTILPVDKEAALTWLERAAKADVPEAHWETALILLDKDKEEALRHIRRGVELNNRDCLRYMAEYSKEEEEQFRHLCELVKVDTNYKSQLKLAEYYELGKGCEKDEKKAFQLVEEVYNHTSVSPYDSSHEDAADTLRRYLKNGIGCEVDLERAADIYSKLESDNDWMWELLTK